MINAIVLLKQLQTQEDNSYSEEVIHFYFKIKLYFLLHKTNICNKIITYLCNLIVSY